MLERTRIGGLPVQESEVRNWLTWEKHSRVIGLLPQTPVSAYRPMTPSESASPDIRGYAQMPPEQQPYLKKKVAGAQNHDIKSDAYAQLWPEQQPTLPLPSNLNTISETIRELNLLSLLTPGIQSVQCPPNTLFEAGARLASVADLAERFLGLLENGNLKAHGWEQPASSTGTALE